jgi:death on curing protein
MFFLNRGMVVTIHAELIDHYGGSYGIRDENLLQSAIARPLQLAHYEPQTGIARLGAVLSWGLAKNHTFIDGNKRIAFAALVTFLKWNGYRLTCSEAEETVMILRMAASEIDEAAWTEWVERAVAPL